MGAPEKTSEKRAAPSRAERVVAASDLIIGALVLGAVWGVLPARWMPLDVPASLLGLAFLAAGGSLLAGKPFGAKLARIVAAASLASGALLCTALAFTAAHISGLYGPVGGGGAILLFTVAVLVLPYLVLVPAAQLFVLLPGDRRGES